MEEFIHDFRDSLNRLRVRFDDADQHWHDVVKHRFVITFWEDLDNTAQSYLNEIEQLPSFLERVEYFLNEE